MNKLIPIVLLSATVTACAQSPTRLAASDEVNQPVASDDSPAPEADRQAILAMAGEYDVDFAFDETVVLQADYERQAPKRSGAHEAVIVVEDSGDRIVLQHLLLVGDDHVIKHWRQDWVWQADERLVFTQDQTWDLQPLSAEDTKGQWTQCVYGVADAPRYCGTGAWNHRYGQATWTSDRSWRPLPRREYTTRDDYNALNVENRHTITPHGWTHEQDNSKVVRDGTNSQAVIAREFGFNDYRRTEDIDFSPAYAYWAKTAAYWAQVRQQWDERFAHGGVRLATDVDGSEIIEGLFGLADQAKQGEQPEMAAIEAVFNDWVQSINTEQRLSQTP
jgi:hypothetical protein